MGKHKKTTWFLELFDPECDIEPEEMELDAGVLALLGPEE